MASEKETRTLRLPVEIRSDGNDGDTFIEGRAVVYGQWSHDLGGFRERFAAGAFGNLKDADIIATLNHDEQRQLLGRTPKTLKLRDSDKGLDYQIRALGTQASKDAQTLIEEEVITGSSFTFRVRAGGEEIDEDKDGMVRRTVTDAELFEVAPVSSPAYPQTDTSVAQRSIAAFRGQQKVAQREHDAAREAEIRLRAAKLSL